MNKRDVKIGTTYRIRGIDDLAAEFGLVDGAIRPVVNTPCILRMDWAEMICGMPFTPKREIEGFFYSPHRGGHVETCYESEEGTEFPYADPSMRVAVTAEMLEPFDKHMEPEAEISPESLLDFLLN